MSATGRDLRDFLKVLETERELVRVRTQVDWNLEAGAISRLACERQAPAPLFENVKDYPGQQLAAVLLGPGRPMHARLALALGLENKAASVRQLIDQVKEGLRQRRRPVQVERRSAPCKEVVVPGAEANLLNYPIPWIKSVDGGRYIGTWNIVVVKDPESQWVNWATYRCMLRDEQSFTVLLLPDAQHGGHIFGKYEAAGKPMPIALVIGAHPAAHLAAITSLEHGVSEAEVAGGYLGEGVPLVKCETNDLEVPANAEMVIEAEILPGVRADEGPFGEYTGHVGHGSKAGLARVTCVTHRRNPIHTMANMGKPHDDAAIPQSILLSAVAEERLKRHGIAVKAVYYHTPQVAPAIAVKPEPGVHQRILGVLLTSPRMAQHGAIFVDEDVDVTDLQEVFWAMSTRMHAKSYQVIDNAMANPLNPALTPEDRQSLQTGFWVVNAWLPYTWSAEYRHAYTQVADFANSWPEDLKRKVLERWHDYGYER